MEEERRIQPHTGRKGSSPGRKGPSEKHSLPRGVSELQAALGACTEAERRGTQEEESMSSGETERLGEDKATEHQRGGQRAGGQEEWQSASR